MAEARIWQYRSTLHVMTEVRFCSVGTRIDSIRLLLRPGVSAMVVVRWV